MPFSDTPQLRGPWSAAKVADHLDRSLIPMRIAVETPSGWPLVLSVWFLTHGGEILAATRPDSTLVRCLEHRPRCGFEIASDTPPYRGVRGRAQVEIDRVTGADTLDQLLVRYLGGTDNPLAATLRSRAEDEVCLRLRPVSITSWDFSTRMADSLGGLDDLG